MCILHYIIIYLLRVCYYLLHLSLFKMNLQKWFNGNIFHIINEIHTKKNKRPCLTIFFVILDILIYICNQFKKYYFRNYLHTLSSHMHFCVLGFFEKCQKYHFRKKRRYFQFLPLAKRSLQHCRYVIFLLQQQSINIV